MTVHRGPLDDLPEWRKRLAEQAEAARNAVPDPRLVGDEMVSERLVNYRNFIRFVRPDAVPHRV